MAGVDFKTLEDKKVMCRAGQYARIVEAPYSPKNVGKLVFIEEMVSPYMPTGNPNNVAGHECSATWRVRGIGGPLHIPDEGQSIRKTHIDTMMIPIDYLTVLTGGRYKTVSPIIEGPKRGRPRKQAI